MSQSANVLKPGKVSFTISEETTNRTISKAFVGTSFGLRVGILNGLEIQGRTNLATFDAALKWRINHENSNFKIASGLIYGRADALTSSDYINTITSDKILSIPLYLSKDFNKFTVFGGTKFGYAFKTHDPMVSANLGLAYKFKNKSVFIETYAAQIPQYLVLPVEGAYRTGISMGICFGGF